MSAFLPSLNCFFCLSLAKNEEVDVPFFFLSRVFLFSDLCLFFFSDSCFLFSNLCFFFFLTCAFPTRCLFSELVLLVLRSWFGSKICVPTWFTWIPNQDSCFETFIKQRLDSNLGSNLASGKSRSHSLVRRRQVRTQPSSNPSCNLVEAQIRT